LVASAQVPGHPLEVGKNAGPSAGIPGRSWIKKEKQFSSQIPQTNNSKGIQFTR